MLKSLVLHDLCMCGVGINVWWLAWSYTFNCPFQLSICALGPHLSSFLRGINISLLIGESPCPGFSEVKIQLPSVIHHQSKIHIFDVRHFCVSQLKPPRLIKQFTAHPDVSNPQAQISLYLLQEFCVRLEAFLLTLTSNVKNFEMFRLIGINWSDEHLWELNLEAKNTLKYMTRIAAQFGVETPTDSVTKYWESFLQHEFQDSGVCVCCFL